ncbi:MAG: tetratricopeptide repeat protein, partial [Candidatus Aminicenantes bacterium]|nr:tetratricopeptide repeat protein [Candidatus Aminicenantes bacterium]
VKKLSEYTELPNILEQFSLLEFSPAHYRIQVSLWAEGKEILFDKEDFDVSYADAMARPWVFAKVLAGIENPVYEFIIGSQLFNSGKLQEAQGYFERAYQKDANSTEFALGLAQVYLNIGKYEKIEPILQPFFNLAEPAPFEMFFILGKAYQNLGELNKAVDTYNKTISHYGLSVHLLNSLGECYFSLDNIDEALAAWEKSLEIDPNQIEIKKKVYLLKEKKEALKNININNDIGEINESIKNK